MVSDARYARDVSKQLLEDALAQKASAIKMFESAIKTLESAIKTLELTRDNLDQAHRKVRAAEAVQKETEEKWPEIVIDDETSTDSPPSKKRQKISAPSCTGGIAIATATTGSIVAAAAVDRSTQVTGGESSATKAMDSACNMEKSSRRMIEIAIWNSKNATKDLQDATRNYENAKKNVEVARECLATSSEEASSKEVATKAMDSACKTEKSLLRMLKIAMMNSENATKELQDA
jgi:hypothetical protein